MEAKTDESSTSAAWTATAALAGGALLSSRPDPSALEVVAERMQALLIAGQKAEALRSVWQPSLTHARMFIGQVKLPSEIQVEGLATYVWYSPPHV